VPYVEFHNAFPPSQYEEDLGDLLDRDALPRRFASTDISPDAVVLWNFSIYFIIPSKKNHTLIF